MRRLTATLLAAVLCAGVFAALPSSAADPCEQVLCAGAASVDMTWHTGAGQGQLGSAGNGATAGKFDPYHHSTKMVPSDGMQSRTYAKAVVVQGPDGTKVAYVKTELYLQQDIMTRRVAQLVVDAGIGLDGSRIMLGGTHNHSAPHYTSTAWGVWLFADAFDARAFEHTARRIAQAIIDADATLRPARVGASVTRLSSIQQNILGPATADDGSPAGFPRDWFDDELAVVRFDSADGTEPIAALVNFGMHPESIGGSANLISADFVGLVERDVERALGRAPGAAEGPVVAWSQGGLGDTEPDNGRAAPPSDGRIYWRRDFAQAERMSRELSSAVVDTWADVAAGTPDVPEKFVPFSTDAPVAMLDLRFPGPLTHPAPTVSNCRTDHPGVPIVGLPDCERVPPPPGYGATVALLREAGVPVPDNYGAPSFGAVQEALTIHLQVLRIGEVLLGACPCEPIADMSLNFKTRTDATVFNQHLGYEWPCRETAEGAIECDFRHAAHLPADWRGVDHDAYERMVAQIRNNADGWETDYASLQGEAGARDPADIYGNFTHGELFDGFTLPLMVGKANDYVGYVVTYREYSRGDHYRKALTAFGPRTADYINTRLVAMAGALRGEDVGATLLDTAISAADGAAGEASALALGEAAAAGSDAYTAAIPDDGGTPGLVLTQPAERVERFAAATLSWQGGSNWTDNPTVVVQRRGGPDGWETVATQEGGEVVVTLAYDSYSPDAALAWLSGGHTYVWTATFELPEHTRPGWYRFVVDGHHRSGRTANPYQVVSDEFLVTAWNGIQVADLTVDAAAGTASFTVAGVEADVPATQLPGPVGPLPGDVIRYPFTYDSAVPFIDTRLDEIGGYRYCFRCTFRAWAATGQVVAGTVTVTHADGTTSTHEAVFDGARWTATGLDLAPGDVVSVAAGAVTDEFGNSNDASLSATVT